MTEILNLSEPSLYFRGPAGSGKSQLMFLLATELVKRGHSVYYIKDARLLKSFEESEFQNLNASIGKDAKKVYLLIDEVSGPMDHAVLLLKDELPNIVVIGTGIPRLSQPSPAFRKKLPGSYIMLQKYELAECFVIFKTMIPAGYVLEDEHLNFLLETVRYNTGGHLYPFLKLTEHLIVHHTADCRSKAIVATLMKLSCNPVHHACASVIDDIRSRSYSSIGSGAETLALSVLAGKHSSTDLAALENLGYFNSETNTFLSDFLVSTLLNVHPASAKAPTIDFLQESNPSIEQAITLALRNMSESDFIDPAADLPRIENSLSFAFGLHLSKIPGLYLSFQSRAKVTGTAGHPPTVDFYLNGRLDTVLEIILNATKSSFKTHAARFEGKGAYSHFKNTVLLNFDTKRVTSPQFTHKIQNYTFLKQTNQLFKGSKLLKSNVSVKLSAPPPRRAFSAMTRQLLNQMRFI